jgi:tetratricopeptide (TPR) repeat protein/transcriptional regulator with XRE-family HTH domain
VSAGEAPASTGFGDVLRQHRLACGLSQEELAERSGLAVRTIANMEGGRTARPHRRSVLSLADALSLPEPHRAQLDRLSRLLAGPPPVTAGRPEVLVPRQLPAVVQHFSGRAGELDALTSMVEAATGGHGPVVIFAISGTAGVGKTALAVQWAHRAAARFPDGQLYVNLRGYDPGQPMPATDALGGFLRALGVHGQDIPPDQDERAGQFRSLLAGRRVLVVLDNAGDAAQVRPLLPGTSGCAALVTSRDALAGLVARDGARRLELDLLPLADAIGLLRALIGDRVTADPAAAARLAAQCSRLPLALRVAAELAAARRAVPLSELTAELADQQRRLDLLDAGGDPRTAVRAVFSWSCRHLDPAAVRAFRLAGLHPGADLDAHAVAALTGASLPVAGQLLSQLAKACLIQPAGPLRYVMHDLLRDYARELATAQDSAQEQRSALTRLLDYYLAAASAAMDTLEPAERYKRPRIRQQAAPGPALTGQDAARAWLDAERASLVAVTTHAATNGWPRHAGQLAATLFRYMESGGFPEAPVLYGQALEAARQTGDRTAEAIASISLSVADLRFGLHAQATSQLQGALAICRDTGDRTGEAEALTALAVACLRQCDYARAAGHAEQALPLFRQAGDFVGEGHALVNLGLSGVRLGHYELASEQLTQALALFRQTGYQAGEARALADLGAIALHQGRRGEAADYAARSLALCRQTSARGGQAYVLSILGDVTLELGRGQQAAECYQEALQLHQEMDDRAGEARALVGAGDVLLSAGQLAAACAEYSRALGLASEIGDSYEEARAHDGLAGVARAAGDSLTASRHRQLALARYRDLGVPEAGGPG